MDLHPVEQLYCSNDGFWIPVMLLCKQQVNESLTLHAPMERASDENACNHWRHATIALGFTLDQCSEMGKRNLDTREAAKCIGIIATTQLLVKTIFLEYLGSNINRGLDLLHCPNLTSRCHLKKKCIDCFLLYSFWGLDLALQESATKDKEDRSCVERMRLALSASQRAEAILSSSEPAPPIPKSEHRTILKFIYARPPMAATDFSHFVLIH